MSDCLFLVTMSIRCFTRFSPHPPIANKSYCVTETSWECGIHQTETHKEKYEQILQVFAPFRAGGQESTLCFLPSERLWGPPSQLPLSHNHESRVEMSGRECCSPGGQSINQGQKAIIVSSALTRLGTSLASSAVAGLCRGLPPTGLSLLPHPLQFPRPLLSLPLFHWPHPSHHWPPTTRPAGFISGQPPLPW